MKKQVHVYYIGTVQGVGFRFTAVSVANDLGIGGWVRNLDSGKVEVVAEAEEDTLKNFLAEINRIFSRYIHDVDINWLDATDRFKDFGVKF